MRRRIARVLIAIVAIGAAVYVWNASWRVSPPQNPQVTVIAHRGVHQSFDNTGLTGDTCTAEHIEPPAHDYIENTIDSMSAAFEAGAGIVELDVHPTTDGRLAVMHDWTLDCRTEGTGETRSHDMAYLKTLDLGYGYTADGGQTFPLRGKGIGLMPELEEVLAAFPDGRFLINYKSNEAREADMLAAIATAHPEWRAEVWGAYGGDPPTFRSGELIEGLEVWSARGVKDCLIQYGLLGWSGHVPDACRNTMVMLPINLAPYAWGWPNLFLERMRGVGSEVILLGDYTAGDPGTSGIDTLEALARVPPDFDGYIWTNKIEVIGPALSND